MAIYFSTQIGGITLNNVVSHKVFGYATIRSRMQYRQFQFKMRSSPNTFGFEISAQYNSDKVLAAKQAYNEFPHKRFSKWLRAMGVPMHLHQDIIERMLMALDEQANQPLCPGPLTGQINVLTAEVINLRKENSDLRDAGKRAYEEERRLIGELCDKDQRIILLEQQNSKLANQHSIPGLTGRG